MTSKLRPWLERAWEAEAEAAAASARAAAPAPLPPPPGAGALGRGGVRQPAPRPVRPPLCTTAATSGVASPVGTSPPPGASPTNIFERCCLRHAMSSASLEARGEAAATGGALPPPPRRQLSPLRLGLEAEALDPWILAQASSPSPSPHPLTELKPWP